MTQKTFDELESKILATEMDQARQHEMLQLVARLKAEMNEAQRQSLARLKHPVEELRSSVVEFDQSHPKLVQAVNSLSNTLASLGI